MICFVVQLFLWLEGEQGALGDGGHVSGLLQGQVHPVDLRRILAKFSGVFF